MKIKVLATFLGLVVMGGVAAQTIGFPDVSEDQWFYPYVMQIKDWNIVNGNDDGTFAPSRNINRAEFSKMIVRYDERVDTKISEAITNIPTPTKTSDTSHLPTVMHFDRRAEIGVPNKCPTGWTELQYGRIYENTKNITRRTCITQKSCQTVTLRDRDKKPTDCPRDWTEADFGYAREKEQQRVCFICIE